MSHHPPVTAPDGTTHRIPTWRRPMAHVVGWLPIEHGPRYMSKLYRRDDLGHPGRRCEWSRWLMWRRSEAGRLRLGRPRWRRGRRP